MKLRSESIENTDFSGPKGEFENLFSDRNVSRYDLSPHNQFSNSVCGHKR